MQGAAGEIQSDLEMDFGLCECGKDGEPSGEDAAERAGMCGIHLLGENCGDA